MKEKTKELISLYSEMISWDHHKTRDGVFCLVNYYSGWSNKEEWYLDYNGYINEDANPPSFRSYDKAEEYLQGKLIAWIKNLFKLFADVRANPKEYDMYIPPVEEELHYKERLDNLLKM